MRVGWRMIVWVSAAASMAASAALATQEPPRVVMKDAAPTRVAPVTVQATRPVMLRKQTFGFVRTFAGASVKLDQLARWTEPVCVSVQGLPAVAAEVKGRVEEVAADLKVKVRQPGCKPNIQIFFTDQPQALLDRVAARHELLLGYWHHRDREKLKTVTHPIQAWYVTGTGGSGGNVAGLTFAAIESQTPIPVGAAGSQPHGSQLDDEDNTGLGPTGCADKPHFTACLASEFQSVLVVVDTTKVGPYPPGLIADYVVMVAMAQPKSLDGCNVLPSVIDLFSKDCPGRDGQDGLTRADVAYLTSLYKMDLEARKTGQMTDIAGRMADMLLKANTADRLTIQAEDGKAGKK